MLYSQARSSISRQFSSLACTIRILPHISFRPVDRKIIVFYYFLNTAQVFLNFDFLIFLICQEEWIKAIFWN
jgi:hypothetical protein